MTDIPPKPTEADRDRLGDLLFRSALGETLTDEETAERGRLEAALNAYESALYGPGLELLEELAERMERMAEEDEAIAAKWERRIVHHQESRAMLRQLQQQRPKTWKAKRRKR